MIKSPKLVPPKPTKPKKLKIQDMCLDDLYEHKMTPTVLKSILLKEDFSKIQPRYCEKACKLPCGAKFPNLVSVNSDEKDVVIIQSFLAPSERYKTAGQINQVHNIQFHEICKRAFPSGTTFKILNLVKCPNMSDEANVLKLSQAQMNSCSPYLWQELIQIKPKIIISTSTEVSKVLGLKKSNYNNRGEFYLSEVPNLPPTPVILTLHVKVLNMIRQNASGQMYGADYFPIIENDFKKAPRIFSGDIPVDGLSYCVEKIIKDQVRVASSLQEVRDFRDTLLSLPETSIMSWDTETTSLDAFSLDARLLTTQFGFRRDDKKIQALVIPLWHKDNHSYDPDEAWDIIKDVLLGPHAKVGHNLKFDIVFTTVTTGVRPVNACFDTMLMMHSINSGVQGNYSLKDATWDIIPEFGLGGYEGLLDLTLDQEEIKRLVVEEKASKKDLSKE